MHILILWERQYNITKILLSCPYSHKKFIRFLKKYVIMVYYQNPPDKNPSAFKTHPIFLYFLFFYIYLMYFLRFLNLYFI